MRPRALLPVLTVTLLVVAAGCAGLGPSDDATTSATTEQPSTVQATTGQPTTDGRVATTARPTQTTTSQQSLPVDEAAVFRRVEQLLDVNATKPRVTVVPPGDEAFEQSPKLFSLLGATDHGGNPRTCMPEAAGGANESVVALSTDGLDAAEVELLLVHEYVHAIQEQSAQIAVQAPMRDTLTKTIGGRTTSRAVVEGAAVYTTEVYAQANDLRWGDRRPLEMRQCLYENPAPGVRVIYGSYYFGGRYFQQQLDSPADLATVYQQPPRTAEELVHGLDRGSEPPAPLNVSVVERGDWTVHDSAPRGELFVRSLLASDQTADRAASAAAGWGEDEAVLLGDGGSSASATAWALRFDTASDADEFAATAGNLSAARAAAQYPFVRVERVGTETVVVLGGDETFVTNATVDGSNANVTVTAPSSG